MANPPAFQKFLKDGLLVCRQLWRKANAPLRLRQVRVVLYQAATRLPYPAIRDPLVKWLAPKALPAETGSLLGLEHELRLSGEHDALRTSQPSLRSSGEHSSPGVRSSGEHSMPSLDGRPSVPIRPSGQRRKGGTFTPAASGPKRSLTGGGTKLSEDEVRAIQHDALRRKEEVRAVAVITKHKAKFGTFKLEKLFSLPRTFSPEPLKEFRTKFPEVTTETLQQLVPLITPLARDLCDRAAVHAPWLDHERDTFLAGLPPEAKDRQQDALNLLLAMPGPARQALLRMPRAPVAAAVDAVIKQWSAMDAQEIRSMALALAQFSAPELKKALKEAETPVKIAPGGIRG